MDAVNRNIHLLLNSIQKSDVYRTYKKQEAILEKNPELVNKDPYGEGWLIKVKPEDIKAVEDLLDAEAYKAVVNG